MAEGEDRHRFTATPIAAATGSGVVLIGTPMEPSDHRRIERALRFQAQVMSALADAVVAIDNDNRITFFNAAAERMYGVPADEAIGRPLEEMYVVRWPNPGDRERALEAIRSEGVWRGETMHVRRDGIEIPVEAVVTMTRDELGQMTGMLGVLRDMTRSHQIAADLRESEQRFRLIAEELRLADQRKDEFLATLAHELRNPLAPLRNGLEIVQRARDDHGAVEQALGMMERQLHHLVRLVDDLLDVSRIRRGTIELRRAPVDLAEVVRNAVEAVRPAIDERGHAFEVRLPEEPVGIDGDLTRLAQVLANLLSNAAKFTPAGGRIELVATHSADEAVIRVVDTGIGIPTEKLSSIFDIFTQANVDQTGAGLGIGLSIVENLIHLHGGTVIATSAGPNRGAEFTVRLPRLGAEVAPSRVEPRTPGTVAGARLRRVLLADDNVDSAASLATVLGLVGNEVVTAHDGLELLEAAARFRPEVVLLDIGMPKLNGYEACRRLRAEPWGRDVTMIALTGWGHEEAKRQSAAAGFDFHLIKPVDPTTLIRLIADSDAARPRTGGA